MAHRDGQIPIVLLECAFNRLLGPKLEHVYAILVPGLNILSLIGLLFGGFSLTIADSL
jgi:hypothetical protein